MITRTLLTRPSMTRDTMARRPKPADPAAAPIDVRPVGVQRAAALVPLVGPTEDDIERNPVAPRDDSTVMHVRMPNALYDAYVRHGIRIGESTNAVALCILAQHAPRPPIA